MFINKKVIMRFVGTHEEYDNIKDIKKHIGYGTDKDREAVQGSL